MNSGRARVVAVPDGRKPVARALAALLHVELLVAVETGFAEQPVQGAREPLVQPRMLRHELRRLGQQEPEQDEERERHQAADQEHLLPLDMLDRESGERAADRHRRDDQRDDDAADARRSPFGDQGRGERRDPTHAETGHEAPDRHLPDRVGRVLRGTAFGGQVAEHRADEQEHETGEVRPLAADAVAEPAEHGRTDRHADQPRGVDGAEVGAADAPVADQVVADVPHQEQVVAIGEHDDDHHHHDARGHPGELRGFDDRTDVDSLVLHAHHSLLVLFSTSAAAVNASTAAGMPA